MRDKAIRDQERHDREEAADRRRREDAKVIAEQQAADRKRKAIDEIARQISTDAGGDLAWIVPLVDDWRELRLAADRISAEPAAARG